MKEEDKPKAILEITLLFFGSFAIFTFSLVKVITEFEPNQLILFFSILILSLIVFVLVLFKIFKRKKLAFAFVDKY